MIRVLLKVSSPALRAGLRALLSSDNTIKIINDSLDEDAEADVIITSASGALPPSFLDASSLRHGSASRDNASLSTSSGLSEASSAATLLLSDDQLNVRELRRSSRAWGILPTDASAEELSAAIHALSQGLVVGTSTSLFETESEPLVRGPLTDRESEVLGLLAQGLANKQIAVALGISEHTVKFHVSSIYTKLNVTNRTEAVREGLRGGWLAL